MCNCKKIRFYEHVDCDWEIDPEMLKEGALTSASGKSKGLVTVASGISLSLMSSRAPSTVFISFSSSALSSSKSASSDASSPTSISN